jgi:hypothetical protein
LVVFQAPGSAGNTGGFSLGAMLSSSGVKAGFSAWGIDAVGGGTGPARQSDGNIRGEPAQEAFVDPTLTLTTASAVAAEKASSVAISSPTGMGLGLFELFTLSIGDGEIPESPQPFELPEGSEFIDFDEIYDQYKNLKARTLDDGNGNMTPPPASPPNDRIYFYGGKNWRGWIIGATGGGTLLYYYYDQYYQQDNLKTPELRLPIRPGR